MTLEFFDVARMEDYFVKQVSVTQKLAEVENVLELECVQDAPQKVEVTFA